MGKGRLEAFTDGVVAIIITIMVLEMKLPPTADLAGLLAFLPSFAIYALSYLNVGIFWNNHHHMLHATREVLRLRADDERHLLLLARAHDHRRRSS
jgi:uncharacterized membrane protein